MTDPDLPPWALDARAQLRGLVSVRRREVSAIRRLVVHRVGGPDWPRLALPLITALRPHWPRDRRGDGGMVRVVPYWAIVEASGRTVITQDLTRVGPHAGQYNTEGLGIGVLGDFRLEHPTPLQIAGLLRLLQWCCERLELGVDAVRGHTELGAEATAHSAKICPGYLLDLDQLRADLQAGAGVQGPSPGRWGSCA